MSSSSSIKKVFWHSEHQFLICICYLGWRGRGRELDWVGCVWRGWTEWKSSCLKLFSFCYSSIKLICRISSIFSRFRCKSLFKQLHWYYLVHTYKMKLLWIYSRVKRKNKVDKDKERRRWKNFNSTFRLLL